MSTTYHVSVYQNNELKFTGAFEKLLEIGRQDPDKDPTPGDKDRYAASWRDLGGFLRLVIARKEETEISRYHVHLEPLPDAKVRVTSKSNSLPIKIANQFELAVKAEPVTLACR